MSSPKKNNPAEDLMESLLKDVKEKPSRELLGLNDFPMEEVDEPPNGLLVGAVDDRVDATDVKYESTAQAYESTSMPYESTRVAAEHELGDLVLDEESLNPSMASLFDTAPPKESPPVEIKSAKKKYYTPPSDYDAEELPISKIVPAPTFQEPANGDSDRTQAIHSILPEEKPLFPERDSKKEVDDFFAGRAERSQQSGIGDRTVAVTGFQNLKIESHEDKVKVSIGQNRSAFSTGYASWGGGAEASLGQADNLRIAQEKILELERENEKLRSQNDELISASDIIRERSDLLTSQISEYKNDKNGLEESFKNEVALLKGHLHRKDVEMQKTLIKVDDLESRLKFDMKKIRIRERELENRLELIRAEKNAVTKAKDDQILDLRRKMDVIQMEVDSYRQKCVDLNKLLENNQDSFKRTTRALRLAMANLELQEENKVSVPVTLKKVD